MSHAPLARALLLAVAVAGSVGVPAHAAPGAPTDDPSASAVTASGFCPDGEEREFLRLINHFRKSHGKSELRFTATLGAAADHHSTEMAQHNYFRHDLLNGVSWSKNIVLHGYTYNTAKGENIAAGRGSAEGAFKQWKDSPGHRANMLDGSFGAIGIGRAYGSKSKYGWYWTTDFGGYRDAAVAC